MRNNFGAKEASRTSQKDREKAAQFSSPDQLAILWNQKGEVITALPVPGEISGTYDLDLSRMPANSNVAATLQSRRQNLPGLPRISSNTYISTIIPEFSERTRILALEGTTIALTDDDLNEWLMTAERQIRLGTDNFPIFETALDETACSITRLPNGQIAMTEAPRQYVHQARERIEMILGQEEQFYVNNLIIETPLRCVARYFLNALPEGSEAMRSGKETEVTAFILISKDGFSYGLWSPANGLFSEYAFLAPPDIRDFDPTGTNRGFAGSFKRTFDTKDSALSGNPDGQLRSVQNYVKQAFEQLAVQLSPERLEQMELACYSQVVWTVETGLGEIAAPIVSEYSKASGISVFEIDIPTDEAIASGLLFGSFNFGDESLNVDNSVPQINLAKDLLAVADRGESNRLILAEIAAQKRRNRTIFSLWAAPVLCLAVLIGSVVNIIRAQASLLYRDSKATAKTAELKPALDRRRTYETNLKWYQDFIKEVSRLRRQQPVGIGLQNELDSRFPLDIDSSFYVSDLKLLTNGTVEIKGLAQNKDAIATFLKSLEFAGGQASGTKLFSNLTYEIQEGLPAAPAGQPNTQAGAQQAGRPQLTNNLAPGIVAWIIKGNYVPMAEFIPPDPTKKPAAPPPPPATSPAPAK